MNIFFARHGETEWNTLRRVQGTTDIPLNENGIQQAKQLADSLVESKADLHRIYSSGQIRALKTAEIIGERYHLPYRIVDGLEEMNLGCFEGFNWDEIEEKYPLELKKWSENKRYHCTPGGESYQDVLVRFFKAMDWIYADSMDGLRKGKDILVITHGAVLMSLFALKNDYDFSDSYLHVKIDNAKAMKLEWDELKAIRSKL